MVEYDYRVEQQVNADVLSLFNERAGINNVLDRLVAILAAHLRIEAIGIRVMDKEGNIPFSSYTGYSDGFMAKENNLCIRHDKCVCIEITRGEYDPSLPLYTPYGSFYTNELQSLEVVRGGMREGRFRGECVLRKWESLAVIPIRFGHRYFGLIHAVDTEKGMVSVQRVQFLENIASQLALYMHFLESQSERENEFSSLVQRVIHDIRNPINSTKMFVELISAQGADRLDPAAADFLERISRNADYMHELIVGLNDFSHACSLQKDPEKIDLKTYIPMVISDMGVEAWLVKIVGDLPVVHYSSLSLKRVLSNLISNAIKFSCRGDGPSVELSCQEKDMFYQISVKDNGMGIDVLELGRIFDPFHRTDSAKDIPGTGLGLSICRKLIEGNGGRIWAFSDVGKGSTFYFTINK